MYFLKDLSEPIFKIFLLVTITLILFKFFSIENKVDEILIKVDVVNIIKNYKCTS